MASQDSLQLLAQARGEMDRALNLVQEHHWDRPTPCDAWNIRNLVGHVVVGEAAVRSWIQQEPLAVDEALLERDPVRAWQHSSVEADAVFRQPHARSVHFDHPVAGRISGEMLIAFRTIDNALHAWDLLVALEHDDSLDSELVKSMYDSFAPFADLIGATGAFGAGVPVADDADLQTKLLALFGRKP